MNEFFSKMGFLCIEIIIACMFITIIFSNVVNSIYNQEFFLKALARSINVDMHLNYSIPDITEETFIVKNGIINQFTAFDWKDYVMAKNTSGESLLSCIQVMGIINTDICGEYTITYILRYQGKEIKKQATYYVVSA